MRISTFFLIVASCVYVAVVLCVYFFGSRHPASPVPAPVAQGETGVHDSPVKIRTVHDEVHQVTCWYTTGGYGGTSPSISCLPDVWASSTDPKVQP